MKKNKIILISTLSTLGLVFVAGGGIFIWKKKRQPSDEESTNPILQMDEISARVPIVNKAAESFDAFNEGNDIDSGDWTRQVTIQPNATVSGILALPSPPPLALNSF